jgi:hypothetical protein
MQYPTIGQPQYGFAPTMPGMASGGLASLPVKRFQSGGASTAPRYSYNPITQSYTLLTPKQQSNQGSDGGVYPSGQYGSFGEGTPADTNSGWSQMTPTDQAAYYAANPTMAAVTQAGLNALGVTSVGTLQNAIDPIGVAQSHTIAQGINPTLATPIENFVPDQQVTPIAPVQTANLAAMNQQQQTTSPSAVATAFADTVMGAVQDAEDAEQGAAMNAVSAPTAASAANSGSAMGDSGAGIGDGGGSNTSVGDAPSIGGSMDAAGTNDSGSEGVGSEGASPSNKQGGLIRNYRYGGQIMNYEQGGLAAAQQTQSKGRGNDSMLVHMTPKEVGGLQALAMAHGGSLTINPQTGLPEAGFLSSLLPTLIGAGLSIASGGTLTPLMAAGITGLGYGAATGSLKKGLLAGLGAYGGAGLGQGLVSAATPVQAGPVIDASVPDLLTTYGPPPPTTPLGIGSEGASISAGAYTPTPGMAPNVMPPDVASGRFVDEAIAKSGYTYDPAGKSLIKMTPDAMPPDVASGRFVDEGIAKAGYAYNPAGGPLIQTGPVPSSGGQVLGSVAKDTSYAQFAPPPPVQPTGFTAAKEGLGNVFQSGTEGAAARARFGAALPFGTTIAAAAPLAMAAAEPPPGLKSSTSNIRPYSVDISNPSGTPQYTPQDTREREQVRYTYNPQPIYQAAQGGLAALNGQTYDDEYGRDEYEEGGSVKKRKSKSLRGDPYYAFADSRRNQSMEAAIEQNFAKGGMKDALPPRFLSGGGDGMSDSIKARIGGVQEARLADGEFVVPADVVSHLGNGSSKAGAKKLYAMMDKIRKARTGRTRQAPEVNPNKYMPA